MRGRGLAGAGLLLPAFLALALLFSAYAAFFWASFFHAAGPGLQLGAGPVLDNYARVLGSSDELAILADTLWVAFELTVVTLAIGLPLALALARSRSRWLRGAILFSLAVTFLSGGVTRAYAWLVILGNRGLVNTVLQQLGITARPIALVNNWIGVFIALVHFLLPFLVFTLVGAVKNVPMSLEEAARNLGAGRFKAFWLVTVPLMSSGIVVAMALTYAIALSAFLFPLLLGGGKVRMVANHIYERIFVAYDIPLAAATSVVFLVVALAAIAGFSGLQRVLARASAR